MPPKILEVSGVFKMHHFFFRYLPPLLRILNLFVISTHCKMEFGYDYQWTFCFMIGIQFGERLVATNI